MYNFKIGLSLVNAFLNQTYMLAVVNGERSKVILFSKINRFLRSKTQGSISIDLIKKMNYNYITRFKFRLSLYPLLIPTRTPFKTEKYKK